MKWVNLQIKTEEMETAVRLGINDNNAVVDVSGNLIAGPFGRWVDVSLEDSDPFGSNYVSIPHRRGIGSYNIANGRWPHIVIRQTRESDGRTEMYAYLASISEIETAIGGEIRF